MRSSSVPSGSSKSTQEQLRFDHIQTLELLQQFKNENIRLKKELSAFKPAGKTPVSCEPEEDIQKIDGVDLLQLVETNTKQTEEIKLLKVRINQAETELLKSRQTSNNSQQLNAQLANEKLKKREAEMTQAVLELEAGLRSAKSQLLEVDFLKQQNTELQTAHDDLKVRCITIEQKYQEISETNDKMFSDSRTLQSNIGWLEAEVAAQKKRNALLESIVEQKGNDNKKLLGDSAEQNALLRQELIKHVENFQKLQHAYSQATNECNAHRRTIQGLNETVEGLKESLREANEQSTVIFGDSDSERGETFQLTKASAGIAAPKTELPPINTKAIAEQAQAQEHESDTENTFRFQEYLRLKRENKELKMRLTDMGAGSGNCSGYGSSNGSSNSLAHSSSGVSPKAGAGFTSPLPSARQLQSAGASRSASAASATTGANAAAAGGLPSKLRNNVSRKFF